MRAPLFDQAGHRLEHRRHRGLVVGAEDRAGAIADDLVLADDRLDRRLGRDGVEMRAEEDGLAGAVVLVQPAIDVPDRRADLGPGIVLVGLQSESREIVEHAVCDRPFLTRRAR